MAEHPKVKVKTRLPIRPFPKNAERQQIRTERLILRPFTADDFDGIYALRTQPEVMWNTAVGVIDASKDITRGYLARYLPPNDDQTYHNVVCLASTGEIIGTGGMPKTNLIFGWPEIAYMFKKEYWGQGYATEAIKAATDKWWTLPRSEVELEVDAESVDGPGEAPDVLTAMVDIDNVGSRHVLEKVGFKEFKRWTEPDSRVGVTADVTFIGYALSRPEQKA